MAFALRAILALLPGDKALFIFLACLLAPVFLLCLFFSAPVVIHERVPMVTTEQAWLCIMTLRKTLVKALNLLRTKMGSPLTGRRF
ncbi:MAG: hypothetical protein A4E53_02105 [Pelotomaculum sp. PtaB.Bin104]|nr:MAG: hypothetical protein A4E53_02105 [Pelotomaculum sp. PtaB.Bin104]